MLITLHSQSIRRKIYRKDYNYFWSNSLLNVFEEIKTNVTTGQAAEIYGIQVNCHGMAVCPFHNTKI
jgi:DNA primase